MNYNMLFQMNTKNYDDTSRSMTFLYKIRYTFH